MSSKRRGAERDGITGMLYTYIVICISINDLLFIGYFYITVLVDVAVAVVLMSITMMMMVLCFSFNGSWFG